MAKDYSEDLLAHTKEIAVHFCGSLAFQNRPINVLTL